MKHWKRILTGALLVMLVGGAGFAAWAEDVLPASPEALLALESDTSVTVTKGDFITFRPAGGGTPLTGLVFYPGGRVDARAYARPLHEMAAQGFLVALVPVRLNLAFFDIEAADPVMKAYPQVENWAVGGHSLGGVAAAIYAGRRPEVDGLVLWVSYPADDALRETGPRVISIYGSNDMAGTEKFEESRGLLPEDTQFVVVEGGNHAQFGDYGEQPGDKPALISRAEQQAEVVEATTAFLESLAR